MANHFTTRACFSCRAGAFPEVGKLCVGCNCAFLKQDVNSGIARILWVKKPGNDLIFVVTSPDGLNSEELKRRLDSPLPRPAGVLHLEKGNKKFVFFNIKLGEYARRKNQLLSWMEERRQEEKEEQSEETKEAKDEESKPAKRDGVRPEGFSGATPPRKNARQEGSRVSTSPPPPPPPRRSTSPSPPPSPPSPQSPPSPPRPPRPSVTALPHSPPSSPVALPTIGQEGFGNVSTSPPPPPRPAAALPIINQEGCRKEPAHQNEFKFERDTDLHNHPYILLFTKDLLFGGVAVADENVTNSEGEVSFLPIKVIPPCRSSGSRAGTLKGNVDVRFGRAVPNCW